MNEDIPTSGARNHRTELGDRDCSQQSVNSAGDPDPDEECWCGKLLGDFARSAQDAHADRAADGYGQTEADAENAQQGSVMG